MSAQGKKASKAPSKATKPKSSRPPSGKKPDEMDQDVLEFITAIDDYKRLHQRPFPSWSEVLEVLKALGYGKTPA